MNIWGPSMRLPPRGQAVGDGWGAMFALLVVKDKFHKPARVVEEALTESARAKYFQSFPDQARAWRLALTKSTRPPDFQAWLESLGLGLSAGEAENNTSHETLQPRRLARAT
eukprot:4392447-Pyramimonas_sp.AAC.1